MKKIVVRAAVSQEALENNGAAIEMEEETLKAAKTRARYYVTDAYAKASESSTALGYACVLVDGACVFDVFRP